MLSAITQIGGPTSSGGDSGATQLAALERQLANYQKQLQQAEQEDALGTSQEVARLETKIAELEAKIAQLKAQQAKGDNRAEAANSDDYTRSKRSSDSELGSLIDVYA